MTEQEKFMETLHSVAEMVQGLDRPLTNQEIQEYFKDVTLTQQQLQMVSSYLAKVQATHNENYTDNQLEEEEEQQKENRDFLKMYMEDIKDLPILSDLEAQRIYTLLLNGDDMAKQPIINHWLNKVATIAQSYEKYAVNMEDLIQEGNIGLVTGIDALFAKKEMIDVGEYLKESVQKALEDYIDEVTKEEDQIQSVLAKAALVEEAKQAFAEEYVQVPTIQDLADYTKISEEEIKDILNLSLDDTKDTNL